MLSLHLSNIDSDARKSPKDVVLLRLAFGIKHLNDCLGRDDKEGLAGTLKEISEAEKSLKALPAPTKSAQAIKPTV